MKKRLTWIILVLVCALALAACGCKHETWNEANCETPKTCAECGEIEGEALGHSWADATCEEAKTCATCGKIEGAALGHSWVEANCDAPKTCERCALTEGEALEHIWLEATTEAPKTCELCALTEGERIVTDPRFTTASTADIQGKWGFTLELSGDMMGEPNFNGTMTFMQVLELHNDGTMSTYITIVDMSAMHTYLKDTVYAQLAAAGFDKAAADQVVMQNYGMTMDEYIDYSLGMIDFNSLIGAVNFNGVYYVADGKLYGGLTWAAEMSPDEYSVDGDTLTIYTDVAGIGAEYTEFQRIVEEE